MTRRKQSTIKDVAKLAGVSIQTVSRVLNNSGPTSEKTRLAVEQAARELDYHINLAARSLSAKNSQTIGLLVTGEMRYGVTQIFTNIEEQLTKEGKFLSVATADNHDPSTIERALNYFTALNVDGMIVIARSEETLERVQHYKHCPTVVIIPGFYPSLSVSVLCVTQYAGSELATEHLLTQGRTHLFHLAGDLSWKDAQERLSGFIDTCERHQIEPLWETAGSWSSESGYRTTKQVLEQYDFDGMFVANDDLCLGAIRAIHEAGLRVPEDIAVVGFDDAPGTEYFCPPLSTIRQNFWEIGNQALQELNRLIEGAEPRNIELGVELIARASTS